MATFTTVPLSDFFGGFAPKYLVGTTYTASLAFFESVVLPKIDRSRLTGAVIVGDEPHTERVFTPKCSLWLEQKADVPLERFLQDLLTHFVFAQHLRVAMGRFDGRDVQRLRFCLDDSGIVRTAAVEHDEPLEPSWMADRFGAFVALLSDLDIIKQTDDKLTVGPHERFVPQFEPDS